MGVSIQAIEKDSGVISTDFMNTDAEDTSAAGAADSRFTTTGSGSPLFCGKYLVERRL
jgi:hypothetical protein